MSMDLYSFINDSKIQVLEERVNELRDALEVLTKTVEEMKKTNQDAVSTIRSTDSVTGTRKVWSGEEEKKPF